MPTRTLLATIAVCALGLPASAAGPKLVVYPAKLELDGPRSSQRLIVLGESADGRQRDLTRSARFAANNPAVAALDANLVRAAGDGSAVVTVEADGLKASVPVTVKGATAEVLVSFARDVEPILTKAGCNAGACHGAQHGRGGFRLSLFGFDPVFDHSQIVRSAEGRRVVLSDPERSILLLKPTLTMEHGGGQKLKAGSPEYETIKRWMDDGAPEPAAADPHVAALEAFPTRRVMEPGETQQVAVTAVWADGRREDVTATARFDALNEAVAAVTPQGLITAKSRGDSHVMIRFAGQATVVQTTLPFAKLDRYPDLPRHNFIDDHLIAKWRDLGLTPSPACSDQEFLRRAYLDVIGTLPTPAEVKDFLADAAPDKRAKLIDKLLGRPEFVDFWALKWGDLLRINRDALEEKGMWSFHNWVRAALRDNKPFDEFVREVVTAEGSTFTEGPANYYRIGRTAEDWAESTAQLFLGVRMQCAKCHQHPFEKWSQDDYYGMAAFFTRLGTKNSQEFGLFGREQIIYLRPAGEAQHPRKRTVVKPHPLDGPTMDDPLDRRAKLADWLTATDNLMFGRNIANRFWGYLMGRGLVEPLDDQRSTNPASNPELLDALAKDFAAHKYDFKHLLRTVLTSRAYQLGSRVDPGNAADATNTFFARYTVKRLTAEQFADAVDFATGSREKYTDLPPGTRAIQLPDSRVRSFLLDTFGRPARQIACECERTGQPNIAQALYLLNDDELNRKIAAPAGRVEALIKATKPLPDSIEELYLVAWSRPPRPEEKARAAELVGQAPSPREGLQDLLWALVNGREFQFNR